MLVADLPVVTRAICRTHDGRSAGHYVATLPPPQDEARPAAAIRADQSTPSGDRNQFGTTESATTTLVYENSRELHQPGEKGQQVTAVPE
jgi:hypothetical protein